MWILTKKILKYCKTLQTERKGKEFMKVIERLRILPADELARRIQELSMFCEGRNCIDCPDKEICESKIELIKITLECEEVNYEV